MTPKYFTADQCATILGIGRKDLWRLRRQRIATPVLTKGLEQYDRAGLAKMAAYILLRDVTGDRTDRPAQIVRDQAREIEGALDEDALVMIQLQGRRTKVTLSLPIAHWLRDRVAKIPA